VELDRIAGGILQERLAPGPDHDRVGDGDSLRAQLGDARVDVGDLEGEVLTDVRWRRCGDQMHLLTSDIEPRAADAELGAVIAGRQAQHFDVEAQRLVDIVDIDRHVMDRDRVHEVSVALTAEQHNWTVARRKLVSGRWMVILSPKT
jgi:hypothetical protein